ncbi:16S rRNA (cytidine(1402)-2'-O)-methyltransferase [Ferviditalea candida]|uniref:Ribosomal RNA small subunit methyltransferase I n=1 Tax=Ferviditalea candida TaxID=3108399 RepID=A0ABU5ZIQ9_9BACL|nr:16S rRNA (cytidine(1402)-2'-O)-methyltransferase [Paenibacillaceae bacterium T2]
MNIQKSYAQTPSDGRERQIQRGKLYLVGTPIGNLDDMTFRAVQVLKDADWIAAEDTRQTRKLLNHFQIAGRLVSYHEHNKQARGQELLDKLRQGETIALVSDAGLPAISDPGEDLVRQAVEEQIAVIPIPGANAALSALIVSGLPTEEFRFAGFLPRDKKKLSEKLHRLNRSAGTVIVYESPHRLEKILEQMLEAWGDCRIGMARELTKIHEEIARGTLSECLEWVKEHPPRGEYCLVVHLAGEAAENRSEESWWNGLSIEEHVAYYEKQGGDRKQAMKKAAVDRGMSRRDIYNELIEK